MIDAPASLVVFDDATVRAARLPSPRVGQASMLKDTGALEVYYGTLLGWRPPWNAPWGPILEIDTIDWSLSNNTNTEQVVYVPPPFTTVAGRAYRVTFITDLQSSSALGFQQVTVKLKVDLVTVGNPVTYNLLGDGSSHVGRVRPTQIALVNGLAAGSHSLTATATPTDAGGVTLGVNTAYLLVADIGPASNPTIV